MEIPFISKWLKKPVVARVRKKNIDATVIALSSKESRNAVLEDEIRKALDSAKYVGEEIPFEKIKRYRMEVASYQDLPPEQKEEKLKAIQADSEWMAFYDLQAFPPREPYGENEDLFENSPYFKAALMLRADMSVGVGIKDIKDKHSEQETPQEKYIKRIFDQLKIGQLLPKTQLHRDLYGNAYWHIEWTGDVLNPIEKIKIVQPPRMRIRISKEVGNNIIGYAYIPPTFVYGIIPQPVPLDLGDCIHFVGDNFDDTPYGYSKVFGIKRLLQSRKEVNILEPIIYKHYTKPWIHWTIDTEGMSDLQIQSYMNDMVTSMREAGPESDMITTKRWLATVVSGSQAKDKSLVEHLIQDNDSQMFSVLKLPETYFKPKGSTDRMLIKQDDNFRREMNRIQNDFNVTLKEKLIKPLLEKRFGPQMVVSQDQDGNPVYNYEIPDIVWNEVALENMFDLHDNIRQNVAAKLLTVNEGRKKMGEDELTPEQEQDLLTEGEKSPSSPKEGQNPLGDLNSKNPITDPVNNPRFEQTSKRKHVVEDAELRLVIEEK